MNLEEITEGKTKLLVPKHKKRSGPSSSSGEIFYNPAMELNRDICISFLNSWCQGEETILDGMAASGARGVRIANEVNCGKVIINDVSKESYDLINKNIELNNLSSAKANMEAIEIHILNNRYKYDYIDIDPFGTPVPYFNSAVRFTSNGGVIAVTATDTAPLCGTYPRVSERRYSAIPENNWCCHEIGLRILIGYCIREAARYDKGAKPLLSYYDGHHFRTYITIKEGAKRANYSLEKLNYFWFDEVSWCKKKNKFQKEENNGKLVGPLWSGNLSSNEIIGDLEPIGKLNNDLIKLWERENKMPPFFYDTNIIGSYFKIAPPSMESFTEAIEDEGFNTSRTHFTPTGVKTNADIHIIKKVISSGNF